MLDAATRAAEMQKMLAQGMRAAAIAQALGITAQTVYTARSRAKKEATAAKERDAEAPLSTLPTPCRGYQEQRVFILDWRQRMSRYEFEGEPGQGKPKNSRKRVCAMTASQVREQIGGHTATHASTINSAPGLAPARAIAERPVKPRKTGQEGRFFAGQKGVDLELHWRTACTQA
ncbi:helix-turn-helix domain-containing protein [Pseudomonas aeruginosa]